MHVYVCECVYAYGNNRSNLDDKQIREFALCDAKRGHELIIIIIHVIYSLVHVITNISCNNNNDDIKKNKRYLSDTIYSH